MSFFDLSASILILNGYRPMIEFILLFKIVLPGKLHLNEKNSRPHLSKGFDTPPFDEAVNTCEKCGLETCDGAIISSREYAPPSP